MTRTSLALLAASGLLLTACGGGEPGGDGDQVTVVTGFYPLEYAAQRIVGDVPGVAVETLASPGVEAHDLELTPRQVAAVQDADLVVYFAGMQAAVDTAVTDQSPAHSLDVASVVPLLDGEDEHAEDEHSEEEHADDEHSDEEHSEEEGHDHGGVDPHFWLDPLRYATAGDAIADQLAELDPDNAAAYRTNAEQFTADLTALDTEFSEALASCQQHTLVTTHEAFGYLAERYGFDQVGITGITPDAEPSPARMAEITEVVKSLDATAVYAQSGLGGDLADVISSETGTEVLVLDPIESITGDSAGNDYLEVMRANLESLRQGQGCA